MVDVQMSIFDYMDVLPEPIYHKAELAKKYGLSPGQAQAMLIIYGPNRRKFDAIMSAKPIA